MKREQTAVEWLADELSFLNNEYDMNRLTPKLYINRLHMIIEQAKAMEKEQIEKAYSNGRVDEQFKGTNASFYRTKAEQYYNQTYGDEERD